MQFLAARNKRKIKQSFINHYGVDHNMKSEDGLKAYQNAITAKYGEGIITNLQLDEFKMKSRQTKLKNTEMKRLLIPKKVRKQNLNVIKMKIITIINNLNKLCQFVMALNMLSNVQK